VSDAFAQVHCTRPLDAAETATVVELCVTLDRATVLARRGTTSARKSAAVL